MKRNLDLIRDILLDVENWNHTQPLTLSGLKYEENTKQEIGYQLELLGDVDYIDARIIKGGQGIVYEEAFILRMTMAGHEYLDSVRNPEVWKKTKTALEKVGGGAALEVVKDIACRILTELLKASTGL
jgi:hypothetical protein